MYRKPSQSIEVFILFLIAGTYSVLLAMIMKGGRRGYSTFLTSAKRHGVEENDKAEEITAMTFLMRGRTSRRMTDSIYESKVFLAVDLFGSSQPYVRCVISLQGFYEIGHINAISSVHPPRLTVYKEYRR